MEITHYDPTTHYVRYYVFGQKRLAGEQYQTHDMGFSDFQDAVWESKRASGEYRWTRIVPAIRPL